MTCERPMECGEAKRAADEGRISYETLIGSKRKGIAGRWCAGCVAKVAAIFAEIDSKRAAATVPA